jgi:transcriptional repressor NrdR
VQNVVSRVEDEIYALGKDEIPSKVIGEKILEVLSETNDMAYVRFVSVFREFKTLDELEQSIAEQRKRMEMRDKKEK